MVRRPERGCLRPARRVPPGLGGTGAPQSRRRLYPGVCRAPPEKPAIAGGSPGGSGGRRGCAGGLRLNAASGRGREGFRGNLPCLCAARNERSPEHGRSAARQRRVCGRKAPVRERGDGGGTPGSSAVSRRDHRGRRYPGGKCQSRRGDRIRAPRLPRGSRWGRWREGVGRSGGGETAAILRPARCPAANAAAATAEARP